MEIHAHDEGDLIRIAWHLGNRHLPVQLLRQIAFRIRADHVIGEMVEGLGGHVDRFGRRSTPKRAPTRPAAISTIMTTMTMPSSRTEAYPRDPSAAAPDGVAVASVSRRVALPIRMGWNGPLKR